MKLPPPVASPVMSRWRVVCGLVCSLLFVVGFGAGCGKEIGDECVVPADCSPNGDRQCLDPTTNGGYCTVQGCDFDTCPEEAVCVRFFTGGFANKLCQSQSECTLDELCSLAGRCVPRSSETRFCMRTCESSDDCREGYECRDEALMKEHGGEPVREDGDGSLPSFCATAP